MTKTYIVTERSFIDGALREPGYETTSVVGEPGPNLKLKGGKAAVAGQPSEAPAVVAAFEAKHIAGGRYAVIQISDGTRASRLFTAKDGDAKAAAQAEAQRLNEGGQIDLGTLPADGGDGAGGNLPDA